MGKNIHSKNDPTTNQSSVCFLNPTDSGQKIITKTFNGTGFKDWKRAMVIALLGKNKLGFVEGTIKRYTSNATLGKAWDKVNNVVMEWLLLVIDEKIANTLQLLKTAKDIWDGLEERYGQMSCAQLFSIQERIGKPLQSSEETVESFFTKMKRLWDELDCLDPEPTCICSGCTCELNKKKTKIQQGRRLMEFLMKMNLKYQHIRSNILMMKELPTVAEAYRILMQEQTHQELSKTTINDNQKTPIACRVDKRKYAEKGRFTQIKGEAITVITAKCIITT